MRKNIWSGFFSAAGILVLILDGQTAIQGMQRGITFCLNCVVPSLFPFFLLTNLLTQAFLGSSAVLMKPVRKICSIPRGTECILMAGFLGGYPAGAQAAAAAFRSGSISKEEASRLLGFCNNAGPAFLFGMLGALFPHMGYVFALWGIHIAGALTAAVILPPSKRQAIMAPLQKQTTSLPAALRSSTHTMTAVCGWIIVFRVILSFLEKWILWFFPPKVTVLIIGLLELANGCQAMYAIDNVSFRFILCSVILSFGGICVSLQTRSVAEELDFCYYIIGKIIQTFVSLSISCAIVYGIPAIIPLLILLTVQFFRKNKIKGRNLRFVEI